MTKHYTLSAAKRERAGKGVARTLRRDHKIPGVVYGDNKTPVTISLPLKEVTLEHLKGHMYTNLCDLSIDGAKELVLARDVQLDPVTDRVIHVDFMRVTPKTTITVGVPVEFLNQENCPGIKDKGTLNVVRHELELICLATNIPEAVEIDLTPYKIGDAIKINDIKLPAGTKAVTGRDLTIATIVPPRLLLEEEDAINAAKAEAAAAAEAEAAAKAEAAAPADDKAKK